MNRLVIATLGLLVSAIMPAFAGGIETSHIQIRATAPGMPVTGGYVTITNHGDADDRLVGASATFAKSVEIHETIHDDGVMKMRQRDGGIELPAGETVMLKPGGLHIMFMGLSETMADGDMREAVLQFESGHNKTVPAMVLKPSKLKMDRGHEHGHSHSHSGHNHSSDHTNN